ncbi:MAG TPA: hypothetical protein VGE27_14050 [Gemmatimonas sp.]|uniref:hypothetical protein n=1 Tax=Gemmatimonas sp. TaxID=1962908 RepID=UPI002EDB1A9B
MRITVNRSLLFIGMSVLALMAVAIGFGRTYVAPMAGGTFEAPAILHVHGALAMAWVLLFAVQPILIRTRHVSWHRRIGQLGIPLAASVAITMIPAGVVQVRRELSLGLGDVAISAVLGVFTSGLLFVLLVVAGHLQRRNREAHARWMLLATLVVIWPAWFRFRHWMPWVPNPEFWLAFVLADVWILVAMLHDRIARGAVHPVLLWGGLAVIAEQGAEVLLFDSPGWRAVARVVWSVVGP